MQARRFQQDLARSEAGFLDFGEVRVQDFKEVRIQDRNLAGEDAMLRADLRAESMVEEAGPSLVEDGVAWGPAQIQQFEEAILVRIALLDASQGAAPSRPHRGLLGAQQVQLSSLGTRSLFVGSAGMTSAGAKRTRTTTTSRLRTESQPGMQGSPRS